MAGAGAIASAEAIGTAAVTLRVTGAGGVASLAALGAPTVSAGSVAEPQPVPGGGPPWWKPWPPVFRVEARFGRPREIEAVSAVGIESDAELSVAGVPILRQAQDDGGGAQDVGSAGAQDERGSRVAVTSDAELGMAGVPLGGASAVGIVGEARPGRWVELQSYAEVGSESALMVRSPALELLLLGASFDRPRMSGQDERR